MAKPKKTAKPKAAKRAAKPTKAEKVQSSDGVQLLLGNIMEQKDREYYTMTFLALKARADTATAHVRDFRKKAKEMLEAAEALPDPPKESGLIIPQSAEEVEQVAAVDDAIRKGEVPVPGQ